MTRLELEHTTMLTSVLHRRNTAIALGLGLVALIVSGAAIDENQDGFISIFDGSSAEGWINNNSGETIPGSAVQEDGLNPHGINAYVVVYEEPVKDFVLDFEYKLSKGCNSGVFFRVGDRQNPVMTGLEVALDDTTSTGFHDPGAFYDLVKPATNAQKPAGEWNRMTLHAEGPVVTVTINGVEVNRIDQSAFAKPGLRPDGSNHKFRNVAIADLNQQGYFGFQDHGQDCWYRNIRLKVLD